MTKTIEVKNYSAVNNSISYAKPKQSDNSEYEAAAITKTSVKTDNILADDILNDTSSNTSYNITAEYAQASTDENPIITVKIRDNNNITQEYNVNIKNINPKNATAIEIFALCSYADNIRNSVGSQDVINYYKSTAVENSYFEDTSTLSEYTSLKQDWKKMISDVMKDFTDLCSFKQVLDGKSILNMFDIPLKISNQKYPDKSMTDKQWKAFLSKIDKAIEDYQKQLDNKIKENEEKNKLEQQLKHKEMLLKMLGNTPNNIRQAWYLASTTTGIDGFSTDFVSSEGYLTQLQKYLFSVDGDYGNVLGNNSATALDFANKAIDAINSEIENSTDTEYISNLQNEKAFYQEFINQLNSLSDVNDNSVPEYSSVGIYENDLTTDVVSENSDDEKTWCITCYTNEGIICMQCSKDGTNQLMWSIKFDDNMQYENVINFLNMFEKDDNLSFASDKSFWTDFISGKIDEADFYNSYQDSKAV